MIYRQITQVPALATLAIGLLGCFAAARVNGAATNIPPTILTQPANSIGVVGEDILFSVQASGTGPLFYQWYFNGYGLPGQNSPTLYIPVLDISHNGYFAVAIANSAGSLFSSNVLLTVQATNTFRRLSVGQIQKIGAQAEVPITFRSSGRENSVSFSLSFDSTVFSNPIFLASDPRSAFSLDKTKAGAVGVSLTLPSGNTFSNGCQWLGLLQFDLAGTNAASGGLSFTTNPVPISATSTNGTALSVSTNATVQPQFVLLNNAPAMNSQSGLFEDTMLVINPSSAVMTNVNIIALNLGVDSNTNTIKLYNCQSNLNFAPFYDFMIDILPNAYASPSTTPTNMADYLNTGRTYKGCDNASGSNLLSCIQINNLLPGESRKVTLEYYVIDHTTVPTPKYSLFLGNSFTYLPFQSMAILTISTNRYVSNSFLIDFPTELNKRYHVQYAETVSMLATNPTTVYPSILGTGKGMEWIDNGPPKTVSPPINGSRFYRIVLGND